MTSYYKHDYEHKPYLVEKEACVIEAAGEVHERGWQNDKFVRIWDFEDAPLFLRQLSHSGGDEEILAFIPCHFEGGKAMDAFESGDGELHKLKAYGELMGWVHISSHA